MLLYEIVQDFLIKGCLPIFLEVSGREADN